jgi:predicted metal-dependent phosphoesterase TrpH
LIREIREIAKKVEDNTKEWCRKLGKAGYDVSFEEIKRRYPKARGNINIFYPLYLLYLKGYGTTIDLAEKFWSDRRLKSKKIKCISFLKAIKLIKKAGGVPVLAHPWIDEGKILKKIKSLVKSGLKGIELNNGDRVPFKEKGMDKRIKNIAKRYNLILTSGSDYHGEELVKLMPGNHNLGKNNCDEKVVEELKICKNKNY